MKYLKPTAIFLVFFILFSSPIKAQEKKLSAEDVIHHTIAAMGGDDYLKSIKTLYTEMDSEIEGHPVKMIIKEMLPNKGSFEIFYQGGSIYKSWFTGTKGYEITGGQKKKENADVYKDKLYKKNIFGEFDYLDKTLWNIELIGEENVDNEPCYKIKAKLANLKVDILWINKLTFLEMKMDEYTDETKPPVQTFTLSDYKKFDKLTYYSTMTSIADGKTNVMKLKKLTINDLIGDEDFN